MSLDDGLPLAMHQPSGFDLWLQRVFSIPIDGAVMKKNSSIIMFESQGRCYILNALDFDIKTQVVETDFAESKKKVGHPATYHGQGSWSKMRRKVASQAGERSKLPSRWWSNLWRAAK